MKIYTTLLMMILMMITLEKLVGQDRIAYQDAILLAKAFSDNNKEKFTPNDTAVITFLKYYVSKPEDVLGEIGDNPYLEKYFLLEVLVDDTVQSKIPFLKRSKTANINGLDVTNIVNGIASFMINRAKEELTVSFFNRFKKFTEDNPEFKALFPKTTKTLIELHTEHYSEMLPALRTAFHEDLNKVINHLDDLMALEKYKEKLKDHPEIRISVKAFQLFPELETGTNPADIIAELSQFNEWNESDTTNNFKNVKSTVRLAHIFSQSLRSTSNDNTWISKDNLKLLFKDQVALELYLGLIYELTKKEGIIFYTDDAHFVFSEFIINNPSLIQDHLSKFIQLANKVERIKTAAKDKAFEKEDYFTYIDLATDLVEFSFEVTKLVDEKIATTPSLLLIQDGINLYKNIYFEEYGLAILRSTGLLKQFGELTTSGKEKRKLNKTIEKVSSYGLFMANMVEAQTPEQVEALLESAVLPVGSSSIKKHSSFNVSVQSYLGAYYLLDGPSNGFITSWNDDFGVHAPIGISISTGLGKGGSLSLFGSILDLGAIVDYQLDMNLLVNPEGPDEVVIEKDYKIELGQIFSPGGYFVYGFPVNIPLALGVGGQYGPGLSRIKTDGTVIVNDSQWRWNVFLSIDIPFFTISNINKQY